MFSFIGDIVCDPFGGSGTTLLAAAKTGRHGIAVELDLEYARLAARRLKNDLNGLFDDTDLQFYRSSTAGIIRLQEESSLYKTAKKKTANKAVPHL